MTKRALVVIVSVATALLGGASFLASYPLDAYEYTGIRRLRAFQLLLTGGMRDA